MFSLVDSHCHLDFSAFDQDREQVLERARAARITDIIIPGITPQSCEEALKLIRAFDHLTIAVGIHPNEALIWESTTIESLERLAQDKSVVAIGEIGLDYYRDRAPIPLQRQVFEAQLELATELGLPVIIHSREAMDDTISILKQWLMAQNGKNSRLIAAPGELHSFSGNLEQANDAIGLNFYLGISGPVTFQNARQLQEVARSVPLEKILLETDAPFLTPHPHRGERNEPAYVRLIADKIAELRGISVEVVAEVTTLNVSNLFFRKKLH